MVSILQVPISAFQDKLGWSRKKSVTIIAGGSAVISILLFSTHSAIKFVDIIDHFANNIGIVFGALMSIVMITWFKRSKLPELEQHINAISSIQLGQGWRFMLTVVTPLTLLVAFVLSLIALITTGYGDYPVFMQLIFGWGIVLMFILGALALSRLKDRQ
jgi:NSS family neurotransmitter:Na+ symporter